MITRAIVKQIKDNKILVDIPIIDGLNSVGSNSQSRWASILYIPGIEVNYKINDIVIVGFEDYDYNSPIVLGYLKLTSTPQLNDRAYGDFNSLKVENGFKIPDNSTIEIGFEELNLSDVLNKLIIGTNINSRGA